jgi:NAD(P)-dependent dehydrogenase (short-subunit alcohol dehydrogenase family)
MNPTYDFDGQVALVTGASSGMGLATAAAFARAGACVVLADTNERATHKATAGLTAAGLQAIGIPCDVADEAQVAAMMEHAVAHFGVGIVGIMVTNLINSRLVTRVGVERLLSLGNSIAAAAGIALAVDAWTDWGGLTGLALPLFLYVSATGFIIANSVAGALAA